MIPKRIGKLRNVGNGIEGHIRIDGRMHRITVVPNTNKQGSHDADMFVLLIEPKPTDILRDRPAFDGYETK